MIGILLVLRGCPLWEELRYGHIGGLSISLVLALVLAPVVYAMNTLDVKLGDTEKSGVREKSHFD